MWDKIVLCPHYYLRCVWQILRYLWHQMGINVTNYPCMLMMSFCTKVDLWNPSWGFMRPVDGHHQNRFSCEAPRPWRHTVSEYQWTRTETQSHGNNETFFHSCCSLSSSNGHTCSCLQPALRAEIPAKLRELVFQKVPGGFGLKRRTNMWFKQLFSFDGRKQRFLGFFFILSNCSRTSEDWTQKNLRTSVEPQ